MSWLESLASSNLPGSIAIVIAILLIAAYIVFVIPIIKENEDLKESLKEHEDNREDELKKLIADLHSSVKSNPDLIKFLDDLRKFQHEEHTILIKQLDTIHNDTQKLIEELISREEVEAFIAYLQSHADKLQDANSAKFQQICDVLNSIKSLSEDIKDKQSTLNGALFMSGTTHRGIK